MRRRQRTLLEIRAASGDNHGVGSRDDPALVQTTEPIGSVVLIDQSIYLYLGRLGIYSRIQNTLSKVQL